MLAAGGVAIDYATAYNRRAKLDIAADSAVLAAVKAARDAFVEGRSDWQAVAQASGSRIFSQNAVRNVGGSLDSVQITVQRSQNEFSGLLSYVANSPTSLMKLFRKDSIEISNAVSADFAIANYLDVHLLIDASPSMGIGATLADQTVMFNGNGCALACHQQAGHLEAIRALGARTRIDIVRDATRRFIDDLRTQRATADQIRLSITLFSNDVMPLFASSTDLDAAYAAAAGIELQTYPAFGTNMTYSLERLRQTLPPGGSGFRASDRKSYVVLLSDGIEDSRYRPAEALAESSDPNFVETSPFYIAYFERLQSMERASCDAIKADNHDLLTAHVEYLVPPAWDAAATPRFDFIAQNLIAKSIAEFEGCASAPEFAFNATDSDEIAPMFDKILDAILSPSDLRLTN